MTKIQPISYRLVLAFGGSLVITLLLLWGMTAPALAHPSGFPFRYVAPNGVDDGDCHDPAAPCATIVYAINQALPGDQVRVAAGTYYVAPAHRTLLLSEIIPVKGGYSQTDAFAIQEPDRHKTYLLGLDPADYTPLRAKGFTPIRDGKEIAFAQSRESVAGLRAAPTETTPFTRCRGGQAGPYVCQGIDLLARLPLDAFSLAPAPTAANDVWGFVDQDDGREYAIIGLSNGTAVVDVTDPLNPVEVGTVPGTQTFWRDVKVYQFYNDSESRWNAYAYVVADGSVDDGLQIIDLSELPAAISLTTTYTGFKNAHNIYISDVDYATNVLRSGPAAYAYIMGSNLGQGANRGGVRLLDLSQPTAPIEVAAPPLATYVHDGTTFVITDSRTIDCAAGHNPCELFIDFNEDTVDIWDVTAKAEPVRISATPYAGARYTHSGWWSEDKMFLFIQDELDEWAGGQKTRLRTLDISDLTTPFVSRIWTGPTSAIDHNGFSRGSHYYMSTYRRGLTILDIADPNNPAEITFFDTFPGSDSPNFSGAWGVYPYLPSGTILVSDIESGLFLLREQGLAIQAAGPQQVEPGQPITYTLTVTNNGLLPAKNLVITNALPAGVTYLGGGTPTGAAIRWTVASLPPGETEQVTFTVITDTETLITNDDYAVQAEGSISPTAQVGVRGDAPVVTLIGGVQLYLPLIVKG